MVFVILDYTLNGILKKIFKKTMSLTIKNMGILNVPPPMTPHRFRGGVHHPMYPPSKAAVIQNVLKPPGKNVQGLGDHLGSIYNQQSIFDIFYESILKAFPS